ncbi:MAG TPA: hypothetical protein VIQ23_12060 [Hanamia sp.]
MQDRQSVSVNRADASIGHSKQLDSAIPASKIAALSSGEFVGLVADNPDKKIKLKMFHAEIINDVDKLNEGLTRHKSLLYPMLTKSRCWIITTRLRWR